VTSWVQRRFGEKLGTNRKFSGCNQSTILELCNKSPCVIRDHGFFSRWQNETSDADFFIQRKSFSSNTPRYSEQKVLQSRKANKSLFGAHYGHSAKRYSGENERSSSKGKQKISRTSCLETYYADAKQLEIGTLEIGARFPYREDIVDVTYCY